MTFHWKHVVLFYALLAASHNACAEAMFAGYAQFCGVAVITTPNPHIASAAMDTSGKPVIFIDPSALSNWTAPTIFMIAHECAHHKQGHILPDGMKFRKKTFSGTKQQELEADCWAAGRLADIMAIKDFYRVIVYFFSQGSKPQGNYPTGMERAAMVVRCAKIQAQPVTACTTQYGNPGEYLLSLSSSCQMIVYHNKSPTIFATNPVKVAASYSDGPSKRRSRMSAIRRQALWQGGQSIVLGTPCCNCSRDPNHERRDGFLYCKGSRFKD